jgi:hypothetical protein
MDLAGGGIGKEIMGGHITDLHVLLHIVAADSAVPLETGGNYVTGVAYGPPGGVYARIGNLALPCSVDSICRQSQTL